MDPKLTGIFNGPYNNKEHTSMGMSLDPVLERSGKAHKRYWAGDTARICNCCGAYAGAPDDDISQPSNGILISVNNEVTKEQDTEVFTTKHIQTKNGVSTVSVRKNWQ